jgi:hypothetical protein
VAANKFKIGDIVTPNAVVSATFPEWKGTKLKVVELTSYGDYKTEILYLPLKERVIHKVGATIFLTIGQLEYYNDENSNQCNCELQTLMIKGCQCGGK